MREMAGECERGGSGGKPSTSLPHVLIVDNCPSDGRALDDVFAPMFALDESVARPYIIGERTVSIFYETRARSETRRDG